MRIKFEYDAADDNSLADRETMTLNFKGACGRAATCAHMWPCLTRVAVGKCPSSKLALTNKIYFHPADFAEFDALRARKAKDSAQQFVKVKDFIFTYELRRPRARRAPATHAAAASQRAARATA